MRVAQLLLSGLAAACLCSASAARAGSYTYLTIDPPGSRDTVVGGMNNRGDVVGTFTREGEGIDNRHGFIWSQGIFTVVDGHRPKDDVALVDINEAGVAVGRQYRSMDDGTAAEYRSLDATLRLPPRNQTTPRLPNTYLTGINNHNVAVGYSDPFTAGVGYVSKQGFVLLGNTITKVPLPANETQSVLSGINNAGTSFGYYLNFAKSGPVPYWFTFALGQVTLVPYPPRASYMVLTSINPDGDLTGFYYDFGGAATGVRYAGGHFDEIAYPGARYTYARFANGQGVFGARANTQVGDARTLFLKREGSYFPLGPSEWLVADVSGLATDGSFAGTYQTDLGGKKHHGYVAVCGAGQQPCTR